MRHLWHKVRAWFASRKTKGYQDRMSTDASPKLCHACGKLLTPQTRLCPYCNIAEPTATAKVLVNPEVFIAQKAWPVSLVFSITALGYMASLALSSLQPEYEAHTQWWAPQQDVLAMLGASHADLTLNYGEHWRLITAPFLHANLIHIAFNLYAFAFLGVITLYNFGLRRFWLTLAGCGIMANIFSAEAVFLEFPSHYATGFTSILFGLLGMHYVHLKMNHHPQMADKAKSGIIWGHILFLGLSLLNMVPIDHFGHLGGMFAGIVLGYWYETSKFKRWIPTIETLALCLAAWFLAHGWHQVFLKVNAFLNA